MANKINYANREAARVKRFRDKATREANSVPIRKPASSKRRNAALADPFTFFETYFGHRFYNPLTEMHRHIIEEGLRLAKEGGEFTVAAPRREGKTTIAECLIIYCLFAGILKFPIIIAANKSDASQVLDNIKDEISTNDLLADDFPETCDPIRCLEGGTSKPKQYYDGKQTKLKWFSDLVVLPTVPPKYRSRCCGAILTTRGIDAAIRGIRIGAQRPDFVLGDDLETRESANSEAQIKSRREIWDRDVAGLGGQGKTIGFMVLGTIQNRSCLMAEFTDRQQRPSMNGVRYKSLIQWPDNKKIWEEYVTVRNEDRDRADEMYTTNREEMDRGAIVLNPANYKPPKEQSTLQSLYNWIADRKMPSFLCELQNDPPDENELNPDQISADMVGKRINGLEHTDLPRGAIKIVSFVDIGDRNFNWVDVAWGEGCIGDVLDYGITDVRSGEFIQEKKTRDPKTLELAILSALHDWRSQILGKYRDANGQTVPISLALVDSGSGLHIQAVYKFCREAGPPFFPSKGMGDTWKIPDARIDFGDRWALTHQPGVRLYQFESTHWKKFCHERFLTPTFDDNNQRRAGSLAIFVCPENHQSKTDRLEYRHQVVGEVWGVKKLGGKPTWITTGGRKNHFLDATAGCCLAANILGIKLVASTKKRSRSFAEMRAAAQRK